MTPITARQLLASASTQYLCTRVYNMQIRSSFLSLSLLFYSQLDSSFFLISFPSLVRRWFQQGGRAVLRAIALHVQHVTEECREWLCIGRNKSGITYGPSPPPPEGGRRSFPFESWPRTLFHFVRAAFPVVLTSPRPYLSLSCVNRKFTKELCRHSSDEADPVSPELNPLTGLSRN